ncbi:hypothetical protein BD626DRAFT_475613 [Schizophyllum amplum]|uniref:C2H2-type domain-containing protein n=1 Tax=Schizophyllum amplum TaxID=97359 RepID=A0A550CYJ9_9AGAR|nr:hypothetical protein BD626DRAFT_475613 [Auriculariopsis ampla]
MSFRCDECSVNFISKNSLLLHNVDSNHYFCATCRIPHTDKHALTQHNNSLVHEPRAIQCPLCIKSSTKSKKKKKKNAPKLFKTPSTLTRHLESVAHPHTDITRYHIIVAAQGLPVAAAITIHATPGIYTAPAHAKVIAGTAKPSDWNGTAFQCSECPKTFRSLHALAQHVNSAVHDEVELRCPGCADEFTLTSALVHHLESRTCGLATYARIQMETRTIIDAVSNMLKD